MSKPPDREIKLDDYEQVVNGETYHPHEGESIWLDPSDQVGDMIELGKMARHLVRADAIQGDADANVQAVEILVEMIDDLSAFLAPRVTRWTLTDRRGKPIPEPDGDLTKLAAVDKTLLMWLFGRLKDVESPAERKNA